MNPKRIKQRCYLRDYNIFVDLWAMDGPKELIVGRDIGDVTDMQSYQDQIVKMLLASPEPSGPAYPGAKEEMRKAIYSWCLKLNPWLSLESVKMVHTSSRKIEKAPLSLDRIIGQDHAVKAVTEAMERSESGIGDPQRPLCTLLFMGPTGVGKTFLAKAMSDALALPLVRIDCAEYGEPHEYAKLVGAPPGYVGYENGGRFDSVFDQIKEDGALLLFDEIEKAHRRVHDLILHVLDEGRFISANNKEMDFTQCYIVMTSNLGADGVEALRNRAGFSARTVSVSERDETYRKAMKNEFRPEFVNRLDEVIVFNTLTVKDAEEIASGLLRDLSKRIRSKHKCKVVYSPAAKKHVLEAGFSAEYGVRELRRVIKKEVESCLARSLKDSVPDSTMMVSYRNGSIKCEMSSTASA